MNALAEPIQASSALPELGQLVEVRRRYWAVTEIIPSTLEGKVQHLINLASLDDDAAGEALSVVWELEPGRNIVESAGLPSVDGWVSGDKLSAFFGCDEMGCCRKCRPLFFAGPIS